MWRSGSGSAGPIPGDPCFSGIEYTFLTFRIPEGFNGDRGGIEPRCPRIAVNQLLDFPTGTAAKTYTWLWTWPGPKPQRLPIATGATVRSRRHEGA